MSRMFIPLRRTLIGRLQTALSAGLLLGALAACDLPQALTAPPRSLGGSTLGPGEGALVLFLNGPSKTPYSMTLEIASIEAVREDGGATPILLQPKVIDSLRVVERQILLDEASLAAGKYNRLRIHVAKAQVKREEKGIDLVVDPEGFSFAIPFEIRAGEATPLFMHWNVEQSLQKEVFLNPAFAFTGRNTELRTVLAYVTNEESNDVTVIDRSSDRVVDVLEVGTRPKGIAVSSDSARAYVVNSGSDNMTIIDVKNVKVLHTVNLENGANPSDVAVHPNGRILYVANTALNSVTVLDAASFQVLALIPVGRQPVALATDGSGTRLLVANMAANTVSVIETASNRVITTIPVELQPISVSIDPVGGRAFITHLRSPRTVVLSLTGLRLEPRMNTGPAASVLSDGVSRRVFVSLMTQNRLGVFDPNIDAELSSVPVGSEPNRLALDADRAKVYVVNRGSASVTVLDRDTRRFRTEIPTTKRPYAIVVVR